MTTNQCTESQFALEIRRALIMIASAIKKRYGVAWPLVVLKGEGDKEHLKN